MLSKCWMLRWMLRPFGHLKQHPTVQYPYSKIALIAETSCRSNAHQQNILLSECQILTAGVNIHLHYKR